ncbi:carbohydrate ABC transporter permease [Vibrio sp. F74]|uniref:carbohydrate ABC transporter permease n=1 Tax=Vibrio sp. F74 TaxID=700020 RepID=UPI0035F5EBE6
MIRLSKSQNVVLVPTVIAIVFVFYGPLIWTTLISFTSSKVLPTYDFVGFAQYERLFRNLRWKTAVENMFIFGFLYVTFCLIIGFLLAVLIDQKIRFESVFRTAMLYPLAISFIVTGLVWQWILHPEIGLQNIVRGMGFESFTFDWLTRYDKSIYVVVIAAVWHSSGLVMALMLAGLRGIDNDIWKASMIDGIPKLKMYFHIIIPMIKGMVLTSTIILITHVLKSYDLVVALTKGGPGFSSDIPSKFIVDYLFDRANIGFASAAAVNMLLIMFAVLAPFIIVQKLRKGK